MTLRSTESDEEEEDEDEDDDEVGEDDECTQKQENDKSRTDG